MTWYYVKHGKQQGPVEVGALSNLAGIGAIRPVDLVWTEAFGAEWRAARTVPGIVFAQSGSNVVFRSATHNRDLMAMARASLLGRWRIAIGVSTLLALPQFAQFFFRRVLGNEGDGYVVIFYSLLNLLVGGAIALGAASFWLSLSRAAYGTFGQAFSGFARFGTSLKAMFLIGIRLLLWAILGIVPGIILIVALFWLGVTDNFPMYPVIFQFLIVVVGIPLLLLLFMPYISASYSYFFAFYVLADNPELGGSLAIGQSQRMMAGNRWKFFCINMRFLGWGLLCIPTFGIGLLWLAPYVSMSYAKFFDDLQPI